MVKEGKELVMSCWSAEGDPDNWKWFIYPKGNPRRVSNMFEIQFSEETPDHWQITTDSTTQIGVEQNLEKFVLALFSADKVCVTYKPYDAESFKKEGERIKEYVKLGRAATIKVPGKAKVYQIDGTTASQKEICLMEW